MYISDSESCNDIREKKTVRKLTESSCTVLTNSHKKQIKI